MPACRQKCTAACADDRSAADVGPQARLSECLFSGQGPFHEPGLPVMSSHGGVDHEGSEVHEEPRGTGQRQRCRTLRSEEHTSELQSLMRISYAVFCLKKKKTKTN